MYTSCENSLILAAIASVFVYMCVSEGRGGGVECMCRARAWAALRVCVHCVHKCACSLPSTQQSQSVNRYFISKQLFVR